MKYKYIHMPKDKKRWPQKLFVYEDGKLEPKYTFTRQSLSKNWTGHGTHAMSMSQIKEWCEAH